MKKLFSIVVAVLFAGSMFAEDAVLTPGANSQDATVNGIDGVKCGTSSKAGSLTAKVGVGTNKVVLYAAAWKGVNGSSISISAPEGVTVSPASLNLTADDGISNNSPFTLNGDAEDFKFELELEGVNDEVELTISGSKRFVVWGVTYEAGAVTDPIISASNIDFGKKIIGEEETSWEGELVLNVVGKNLEGEIEITPSDNINVEPGVLPAEGGTLKLTVTAFPGDFSENIILKSGETTKEVVISGTVIQKKVVPGVDIEMSTEGGEKAYDALVNEVAGIKLGTSSAGGSFILKVPQGATKLHLFAAAWKGSTDVTLSLEAPEGVKLNDESNAIELALLADDGISGNSPFTLQGDEIEFLFDIEVSGAAADFDLNISCAARCAVWGAKQEGGATTLLDNSAVEFKAVKMIQNGQVIIVRDGVRYNMIGQVVE